MDRLNKFDTKLDRTAIFKYIDIERERQDLIHPDTMNMLNNLPGLSRKESESFLKKELQTLQSNGTPDYYRALLEEVLEATLAQTLNERIEELIQVAALAIKAIEQITRENIYDT